MFKHSNVLALNQKRVVLMPLYPKVKPTYFTSGAGAVYHRMGHGYVRLNWLEDRETAKAYILVRDNDTDTMVRQYLP